MPSTSTAGPAQGSPLLPLVDRLAALGEMIGREDCPTVRAAFEDAYRGIGEMLVPHMQRVEAAVYPRVEALVGEPGMMDPMRAEHATMRRLTGDISGYRGRIATCRLGTAESLGLRRALFRLYSLLRVHLAEEELYRAMLDRSMTDEDRRALARVIDTATAEPL
jgi:hypothetical protein